MPQKAEPVDEDSSMSPIYPPNVGGVGSKDSRLPPVGISTRRGKREVSVRQMTIGTAASNEVKFTIPPNVGLIEIIPSFLLQNSLVVNAYANVASVVNAGGFVNRITI